MSGTLRPGACLKVSGNFAQAETSVNSGASGSKLEVKSGRVDEQGIDARKVSGYGHARRRQRVRNQSHAYQVVAHNSIVYGDLAAEANHADGWLIRNIVLDSRMRQIDTGNHNMTFAVRVRRRKRVIEDRDVRERAWVDVNRPTTVHVVEDVVHNHCAVCGVAGVRAVSINVHAVIVIRVTTGPRAASVLTRRVAAYIVK